MQPAVPPGRVPASRSVHCAVFTVDIAGFGDPSREDAVRMHMREAMYRHLEDAFEYAGVPWADTVHEDRGDGVLVIVPGRYPESVLIAPLLDRLLRGLYTYNRTAAEIARIRLRAALHAGHVYRDANGLVGGAVNHACRLLDAAELKRTLAATGAHLAFITSEALFDTVVRHGQGEIDPDTFQETTVEVKETRARAWIHLPGMGPARQWAPAVATAPRPAPGPAPAGPPAPRDMTNEALKAEDAELEAERRAAGALSIGDRHRSIKAELGRRSAIGTTKARRSAAGRKAAETRARRKAAGLGPKRSRFDELFNSPPPGGWTDADRVG